jgi:hypothetical protein
MKDSDFNNLVTSIKQAGNKRCHSQKLGARPQKTGRPGNGSA